MKLTKKQTQAIELLEDKVTTEVIYGGAAGGGKTYFGDYWLGKNCLKYPGTRWLMGRSKLKTLKQTTLVTFFKVMREQGLREGTHFKYNAQAGEIQFPKDSVIILKDLFFYPSDPDFDELGSLEITGAFIDEISQVVQKAKNTVKTRIRHDLDKYDLIPKLLGSCNPAKNWLKKEYYSPYINGTLEPYKKFIPALLSDNPHISKHYRENLLSTGDKGTIERLLYGNWDYDDDPYLLMDYDSIIDMWSNHADTGERYITADIARYGSDLFFLLVWDGWKITDYAMLEKSGGDDIVKIIEQLRRKHKISKSNVVCDQDGVGGGVVDFGKYKGFTNNSTPKPEPSQRKPNFVSLADQCGIRMAEAVQAKKVQIACNLPKELEGRLIDEFQIIKEDKTGLAREGKRAIIKKGMLKELNGGKSTDIWDSFKMRYYFELFRKRSTRTTTLV